MKILQTGTYNSMNKGDAAMQLSCASAVQERWPESIITISTPFPEIDEQTYKNYRIARCNRRRLILASFQLLRCILWRVLASIGLRANWIIAEQELQDYLKADVVVDLSGDMLTEDYGPHVAYSHYLPLMFALLLKRPLFICAQSIGPFKWTRLLARTILNRATHITVRDQISYDYLSNIGVKEQHMKKTADLAFLLPAIEPEKALELLKQEGFEPDPVRRLIGVSLSQLVEGKFQHMNPYAKHQSFIDMIAESLDKIAQEYNTDFLFIPHVTGPSDSKDDRQINAKVAARMSHNGCHVIKNDYTPMELKGMIRTCTAMFGARMHANIGALSSAIPTIAISYSHKTPGIMDMLGQSEMVTFIESIEPEILEQKFTFLFAKYDQLKESLSTKLPKIQQNSRQNLEIIKSIVSQV